MPTSLLPQTDDDMEIVQRDNWKDGDGHSANMQQKPKRNAYKIIPKKKTTMTNENIKTRDPEPARTPRQLKRRDEQRRRM